MLVKNHTVYNEEKPEDIFKSFMPNASFAEGSNNVAIGGKSYIIGYDTIDQKGNTIWKCSPITVQDYIINEIAPEAQYWDVDKI